FSYPDIHQLILLINLVMQFLLATPCLCRMWVQRVPISQEEMRGNCIALFVNYWIIIHQKQDYSCATITHPAIARCNGKAPSQINALTISMYMMASVRMHLLRCVLHGMPHWKCQY